MRAPWMDWAIDEIGEAENPSPSKSNARIIEYRKLSKCGIGPGEDDGRVPWCAIFTNAALEESGIPGTRSAMARSYERSKNFLKIATPIYGAIATFWRGSFQSGLGHVGFVVKSGNGRVTILNGNSHDRVGYSEFPISSARFGLVGFYYPVGVPTSYFDGSFQDALNIDAGGKVT